MLLPAFNCGDHLHPSDAGYQEIAMQFGKAFEYLF
jgi:lysophospholipase L1-like esterase